MTRWNENINIKDSFADVTSDREAHPANWYALMVQMNTEKKVGQKLTNFGIEYYIPTQTEIHQWSDRKKKIERIVIPMVVFVQTDEETAKKLTTYSFIYKLLSYPGQKSAAAIPNEQIDKLKFMLKHADSKVELSNHTLTEGETVRIERGPLKGLIGELLFVAPSKPMVAVRIEALGYACVTVSKDDIESL